jgi:hypothetical protein
MGPVTLLVWRGATGDPALTQNIPPGSSPFQVFSSLGQLVRRVGAMKRTERGRQQHRAKGPSGLPVGSLPYRLNHLREIGNRVTAERTRMPRIQISVGA